LASVTCNLEWVAAAQAVANRSEYVSYAVDDGPFAGLLLKELRIISRRAGMTLLQAAVWQCHWTGISNRRIAEAMEISEATVRQHLDYAQRKARAVEHVGWLTAAIEACGFEAVNNYLFDMAEQEVALECAKRAAARSRKAKTQQ